MSVDALGNPLRLLLSAGQAHEAPQAKALLASYEAEFVMGDKAYDGKSILITDIAPLKRLSRTLRANALG